jgi:hypothetical protein
LKKLLTILLMGVLAFNWVGFRLFSFYLEARASRQLEAQLDNDRYDETKLMSIKVAAAHLPYYANSTRFERMEGRIEIGGIPYEYVKCRFYNDSLELLCIPNQVSMNIRAAKDDFFKRSNELPCAGGDKKADAHKSDSKNFSIDQYHRNGFLAMQALFFTSVRRLPSYTDRTQGFHGTAPGQPPDFFS